MFGNFSLPELLVVAAIALIVIGPKDLPRMMRSVGKFVGQARGLARQFQDSMNDAAREADLQEFRDARKALKDGGSGVKSLLEDRIDLDDKPTRKEKAAKAEKVAEAEAKADAGTEAPKRAPVLNQDEMRERARESGFGPKPEGAETAAAEPRAAKEETPRTADATSG